MNERPIEKAFWALSSYSLKDMFHWCLKLMYVKSEID